MKTNDIKKGTRVRLANGWYGTMADNKKGNIRMVTVEGIYTETGSVYSYDIAQVRVEGVWVAVEHTPTQLKMKEFIF